MSEDHSRAADDLVNGLHGVQVAVVARRLRARLVATVDDDKLRLIIQQELQRFFRQRGGIGELGDPAMGRLQQIAKREP